MSQGGSSYVDNLKDGEHLGSAVQQLCEALERQSWWVNTRRGNRLRYWCQCSRQHQSWIELFPKSSTYAANVAEVLSRQSCYNREES